MPERPIQQIIHEQTVVSVPATSTVRACADTMKAHTVGSVLVVGDDDRLLGIFTERDAVYRVMAAGLDPDTVLVEQVMTANPVTISKDRPLINALHVMNEGGFRHLPVVDDGRPVGIVSIRDAMAIDLISLERDLARKRELAEIMA